MPPTASVEQNRAMHGLVLLSFTAGSMDGIAFLALSGVFASAMSGNTILLGLAIGQGQFTESLLFIFGILGYMAGISMASVSIAKLGHGSGWTVGLEALLLAIFTALWLASGTHPQPSALYGLIVVSSIAMGLQGRIGRAIGAPGILTVIFTGTYTTIASDLTTRVLNGDRPLFTALALRQLLALAAYFGGAMIVGVMAAHWLRITPFLPLAAVLALFGGIRLRLIRFDPKPS